MILTIHGAWSTPDSFNYIKGNLPIEVSTYDLRYDSLNETLTSVQERGRMFLDKAEEDVVILAHSLGGLVGINLLDHKRVTRLITLASPLSGLDLHPVYMVFLYYTKQSILMDALPSSKYVRAYKRKRYTKPIDMVVATSGFNQFIQEQNDGVLSVASQTGFVPSSAIVHEVSCNHHEILQNKEVLDMIQARI